MEILRRVQKCEADMFNREKELAHLRFQVNALDEESKLKDKIKEKDMRVLQLANTELENEVKHLRDVNTKTRDSYETKFKSLHVRNNEISNKIMKIENDIIKRLQESEKNRDVEKSHFTSIQNNLADVRSQLATLETTMTTSFSQSEEAVSKLRTESIEHMRNIENVMFTFGSLPENSDVQFQWVLENFEEKYFAGNDVYSPIFYTNIGGYCFQLCVRWGGYKKMHMGLYLVLHRTPTRPELPTIEEPEPVSTTEERSWERREIRERSRTDYDDNKPQLWPRGKEGAIGRTKSEENLGVWKPKSDSFFEKKMEVILSLWPKGKGMVRTRSADSELWQNEEEKRTGQEADMWRRKYETDAAPFEKVGEDFLQLRNTTKKRGWRKKKTSCTPFHHEYTFSILSDEGTMAYKVSHTDTEKCCGGFPLHDGDSPCAHKETKRENCGIPDMLKAPYDRFVINDSMFITCTIHM